MCVCVCVCVFVSLETMECLECVLSGHDHCVLTAVVLTHSSSKR